MKEDQVFVTGSSPIIDREMNASIAAVPMTHKLNVNANSLRCLQCFSKYYDTIDVPVIDEQNKCVVDNKQCWPTHTYMGLEIWVSPTDITNSNLRKGNLKHRGD